MESDERVPGHVPILSDHPGGELALRWPIIGVFRPREQGKTTYAVQYVIRKVHEGITYDKAFTNIHVGPKIDEKTGYHYGDPAIRFVNYAEMMELKEPTVNGIPRAILLVDQVPNYADCRAPNFKGTLQFLEFNREARQHGVDMIYTAWSEDEPDKRLVDNTDLVVKCSRVVDGFVYDRFWRDRLSARWRRLPPEKIKMEQAMDVFEWFDSAELIDDPTLPKRSSAK